MGDRNLPVGRILMMNVIIVHSFRSKSFCSVYNVTFAMLFCVMLIINFLCAKIKTIILKFLMFETTS